MHAIPIDFLELLNGQVQYVVPRWQRRYRWGEREISSLLDDLRTVGRLEEGSNHYGGTLLTFPEPGAAGMVPIKRVIDGQQRLTTVSILLACIAERLEVEGTVEGWSKEIIFNDRLINRDKPAQLHRKLRLQDHDEEEYQNIVEGIPQGAGAVTQAYLTITKTLKNYELSELLRGLTRLRVVSIGLEGHDDPQQIFESINATGLRLTESEKVKNWILMGLPDDEQRELYENHWLRIENLLDARNSSQPIDEFLGDLLGWWTGRVRRIDRVFEDFRRETFNRNLRDKVTLCRHLADLAYHYSVLTGKRSHDNPNVEKQLQHLQAMGIHVHRPLTLRMLCESSLKAQFHDDELDTALGYVSAWISRLWLADRPTGGLNNMVAEIAHDANFDDSEIAMRLRSMINRISQRRVGVPNDREVRDGIDSRRAYGGSASRAAFAVLYALVEHEQKSETPPRDKLTLEHIMPQKLTQSWKNHLGKDAESIHESFKHVLPNLTLCGQEFNSKMGSSSFNSKTKIYGESAIHMTRELQRLPKWNVDSIQSRANQLCDGVLALWPWPESGENSTTPTLRWRLEDGDWQNETSSSDMVVNVAQSLLQSDSRNALRLPGATLTSDVVRLSEKLTKIDDSSLSLRSIPGFSDYAIYPYSRNYDIAAERCRSMAAKCDSKIDVELPLEQGTTSFWRAVMQQTGGLPGQKDDWRGPGQKTHKLNRIGDKIYIYAGRDDLIWINVSSAKVGSNEEREGRMKQISDEIQVAMSDQQLSGSYDFRFSICIERPWERSDQASWPIVAQWLGEQVERLRLLLDQPYPAT